MHAYPTEIYGGLVALLFTGLGLYFGSRCRGLSLEREREVLPAWERRREGGPEQPEVAGEH